MPMPPLDDHPVRNNEVVIHAEIEGGTHKVAVMQVERRTFSQRLGEPEYLGA